MSYRSIPAKLREDDVSKGGNISSKLISADRKSHFARGFYRFAR